MADLIVVLVALPLFAVADVTLAAWGVAAGAWVIQRASEAWLQRRADASEDPRVVVAAIAGGAMARGVFTVLVGVFLPGLLFGDRAGLAAALVIIIAFTAYFLVKMATRRPPGATLLPKPTPPRGGGPPPR